jgi:hypothetical protein
MNLGWDWMGWTVWMECSYGQFSLNGLTRSCIECSGNIIMMSCLILLKTFDL